MDRAGVQRWLDAYVQAWQSYDPEAIGALFSEDAVCYYHPYDEPMRGRAAIVASWLEPERRDPPGTYSAHYEPVVVEGDTAMTNGRTRAQFFATEPAEHALGTGIRVQESPDASQPSYTGH